MLVLPKINNRSPNKTNRLDPNETYSNDLLSYSVPDMSNTLSRRIYNSSSIQLNTLASTTSKINSETTAKSHLFTFDKVLRLLRDTLSQNHIDRQLMAITKLLENRENGIVCI